MRTYALLTDNFRRLLMRCPDCHACWKTGETWEQLAQKARDDRAMQLDALYRKPPEGGTEDFVRGYRKAIDDIRARIGYQQGKA